jgi:hypothetical protein
LNNTEPQGSETADRHVLPNARLAQRTRLTRHTRSHHQPAQVSTGTDLGFLMAGCVQKAQPVRDFKRR